MSVRQLDWWRSLAQQAGSLVIGTLSLDRMDLEFDLKSLLGTLPIILVVLESNYAGSIFEIRAGD